MAETTPGKRQNNLKTGNSRYLPAFCFHLYGRCSSIFFSEIAFVWILTEDLWFQSRQLCQLCNNHSTIKKLAPLFAAAEGPRPTVLFKGTETRDPLADLLFCVVFGAFHLRLAASLDRDKLQFMLPPSSSTIFGLVGADLVGLLPFSFMDDFFAAFAQCRSSPAIA